MEIQHFSHAVSLYLYIILYHCISSISSDTFWHLQHPWLWPLGTMKGPRKPATCMVRGLLHKCTSCDIAKSVENSWRFSLALLSCSTCDGVCVIHSFMFFQLSLQTNQHLWAVPMCCLSGRCTAILPQTETVRHICMSFKGKQSLEYAYISIQPYAQICEWLSCIHVHFYVMLEDLIWVSVILILNFKRERNDLSHPNKHNCLHVDVPVGFRVTCLKHKPYANSAVVRVPLRIFKFRPLHILHTYFAV